MRWGLLAGEVLVERLLGGQEEDKDERRARLKAFLSLRGALSPQLCIGTAIDGLHRPSKSTVAREDRQACEKRHSYPNRLALQLNSPMVYLTPRKELKRKI